MATPKSRDQTAATRIPKKISSATQQYLDILEIKDNTVVLKDGTLRAVLLVSSINFALKSDEEQEAVIESYTQFLNTLSFNLQIVIQSRKLDIDEYLERLKNVEQEQTNELLKVQTSDYRQFIAELVDIADIMTKRFYVVIPYSPDKERPKTFFTRVVEAVSPTTVIHLKQKKFEEFKRELGKRVDSVADALASAGLKSVQLDTQSLIELYYNTYNPEVAGQEKLIDMTKLNIER